MKHLFFALIAVFVLGSCSINNDVISEDPNFVDQVAPVDDYSDESVDFRSVADYEGIWKYQNPFAKYIKVESDGSFVQVLKLGNNYRVKPNGDSGNFVENSPNHVTINGILNDTDWTLIGTSPQWTLEIDGPLYKIMVRVQQ